MTYRLSADSSRPSTRSSFGLEKKGWGKGNFEGKEIDLYLTQTLSSASDSENYNEPCPDGGYGWICVLCSFIFHFFAIGIESAWGVYQGFIFDSQFFPSTNSNLAWVGSIQATAVAVVGLASGLLAEKIGFRETSLIGSTIMSMGLVTASFSTTLFDMYLSHGLIFGLGSGLAFIPAVTIISQWFDKRRGLATGIAVSGSGIGGLVLSPLTQIFIDHFGFRWALRITAMMSFGCLTIAGFFLKPWGHTQRKVTHKVDLALIREPIFLFLYGVGLFSSFGIYVPFFYVPDYATNHLGLTSTQGATSSAIISGLSAAGRIILGYVGDNFGHLNVLFLCQAMSCVSQMAVWPFTASAGGLMAFCAYFGFFSGGFVSLYPVVAAQIYGTERIASISGALFSAYVPGTLVGPPIAGLIIDRHTSITGQISIVPAALFGGAWMGGGAIMAFCARWIRARTIARRKSVWMSSFMGRV